MIARFMFAHGYHPRRIGIRFRAALWYYWPHVFGLGLLAAGVVWGWG